MVAANGMLEMVKARIPEDRHADSGTSSLQLLRRAALA